MVRPPRLRWAIDLTIAGGTGAAIAVTTSAAAADDAGSVRAYLLGVALGALLLVRRRWPVGVLVGSLIVVLVYNAADYSSVSPIWALLVPLFTVARIGQMLIATAVGTSALLVAIGWIAWSERLLMEAVAGALRDSVLLALVLALGTAMRNHELWTGELHARLRAEREQRERQVSQQLLEQRLQVARELHDVTAHALAVVSIQLELAKELVPGDPATAVSVLETARQANQEAIGELQAAVRALRGDSQTRPDLTPAPGTDQLGSLLDRAAGSGLATDLVREGEPRPVPPAVSLTLYRIAQESVTNVLKHSDATSLRAVLRYEPDGIRLTMTDNGNAATGGVPAGHGLTGMRERAADLGGWLSAGPEPGGGFAVHAWLPWIWEPPGHTGVTTREELRADDHSSAAS